MCIRDRRSGIAAQQHSQGGNNAFFCGKTGDKRRRNTPVAKAERFKNGGNKAADARQQAGVRGGGYIEPCIKCLQEPDKHRGNKNNGECLLQKVSGFLPNQLADTARRGKTVVRCV